ncbi:MAG TPA: molybdenum cofactor guanylyltransferase [Capsulimonadaceae bacterium]|jgi:molybdopterin-guanine dinucleotide biosynthesis protein A
MANSNSSDLKIAILAGGQSRRMGVDKLALEINGKTILQRTVDTAVSTGVPVIVVGRTDQPGGSGHGVHQIADDEPGAGPLAALRTALTAAAPNDVVALAADLPYLTTRSIAWLIESAAIYADTPGVAVRNGDFLEPLFSVYRQSSASAIEHLMLNGRRSLHSLIESTSFTVISAPEWVTKELYNLNEPADWEKVTEAPPAA